MTLREIWSKLEIAENAYIRPFEARVGRKLAGRIYQSHPLPLLGLFTPNGTAGVVWIKRGAAVSPPLASQVTKRKAASRCCITRGANQPQASLN
jgi:hypothetical protein